MSEEATIEFSAASKELGDKIAGLTLKEARELSEYLKEEHKICLLYTSPSPRDRG